MNRFHIIEEGAAIVYNRGVYRQVKIYHRDGVLYAAHGGGFVRLYKGGGTSHPKMLWRDIDPAGGTIREDVHLLRYEPAANVAPKVEAAE